MPNHTVRQGDTISSVAEQYGFAKAATIWNHGNNASLKAKRKNGHILFPGDALFVPDKVDRPDSAPTTKYNRYQIALDKLQLILRLRDSDDQPLAGEPVKIKVDGANVPPPAADGDGKTKSDIKRSAKDGTLLVQDWEVNFKIGFLDPVVEQSGQAARLNNLGYWASDPGNIDKDRFQSAVEEFQCDNGIKVTGVCDTSTQDKLESMHGC